MVRTRRAVLAAITALAAVTAMLVSAEPSSAYTFIGCKWGGSFGASSSITYHFSSLSSTWVTAFNQGQYAWDTKPVPGTFVPTSSTTTMNLLVRDYSMDLDAYGTTFYSCSGGTFSNNQTMDFNSTAQLTGLSMSLVAMHELGHSYGLGHALNGCSDQHIGPAIMQPEATVNHKCGGSPPYADDVNGVNARY